MRIVVVGPEGSARRSIAGMLVELGHDVVGEAASTEQADGLRASLRPDLITEDVSVPGGAARAIAEALRRMQARLVDRFDASPGGLYVVGATGELAMANPAALRLLGVSSASTRGRRLADWIGDLRARGAGGQPITLEELPFSRALAGEVVRDFELWIDGVDGAVRCLSVSAAPVGDGDGRVIEAVGLLLDVTSEREDQQQQARRSERRRRELTRLSQEILAASSPNDMAQRCVVRVREALGAERVRMITIGEDGKSRVVSGETGRPPAPIGHTLPPGRKMGIAGYALIHAETVWSGDLWDEKRYEIDEGDAADRSAVAAPLMVGDRVLGLLVCTSTEANAFAADDAHLVTLMANQAALGIENLRLADRLADQQKLAALGLMAAGIVHEIKNPLSFIQANVDSARELLDRIAEAASDPSVPLAIDQQRVAEDRQALNEARNGCSRIFKIIEDIRSYAHPGRARREPNDVNRLVEVALTLAASELRRWCRVTREFARLPEVMCDGSEISQVVLNLVVDAAQSIERTGRLGQVQVITRIDDGQARIIVADDGPGIEPAIMDKIFLPFFTTKPQGHGTGLGLAICRRLMESQGGMLTVDSQPGHGARFTVSLPLDAPRS